MLVELETVLEDSEEFFDDEEEELEDDVEELMELLGTEFEIDDDV